MIRDIIEKSGKTCGIVGTIGVAIAGKVTPTEHTTPESYDLQRYFKDMVDAGCEYMVMEVSSQGIKIRAPILLALVVALIVGALAQQSRLCMVGGIRDAVMFKDFRLISGFVAIIVAVFIGNVLTNNFTGFAFAGQPVAHTEWLWNLLGMALVGWGSMLLGGCPLRQLILAGEGNTDSAVTITGFIVGAAVAHNFGLASSADGIGAGPVALAVIIGFVVMLVISLVYQPKEA